MSLSAGVYVGEGMAPVPKRVADWIKKWEYVEMGELLLLPEFGSCASDKQGAASQKRRSRKNHRHGTESYRSQAGPNMPSVE